MGVQCTSVPGHHANDNLKISQGLNISGEVHQKLLELQHKGIDINALLLEFLEKREAEIVEEKIRISAKIEAENKLASEAELYEVPREIWANASRYIPAKIKQLIKKEFGTKCSIPTCAREAEDIHHTQRFSLSKSHNPFFLAPLCKDHHKIAHSIDVKYQEARRSA